MTDPPRRPPAAPDRAGARSPFASVVPSVAVAGVFAAITVVYLGAGRALPGGRWLAVHLFTLGVVTNLVLAFSEHFSRTLTRSPGDATVRWMLGANAGVVAVLVGRVTGDRGLLAIGTIVLVAVVTRAYVRLRRMRRDAVGARFTWVVRTYERAHGAFVHGAILGALLGTGVLTGSWYGAGRIAHLHVNLLGWGGLTLLATLVFFGPTVARTRILPGADDAAARALRHGATALTVATVLLLATGADGAPGTVARALAAAALGVFAVAATVVCVPVARAARRGADAAARLPLVGVAAWFVAVVWLDVAVVATGSWRFLDALGIVLLVGVLGRAIVVTLGYLAPMSRGHDRATRDRITARLGRGAAPRAVAYDLAVVCLAIGTAVGPGSGPARSWVVGAGWTVVVTVVLVQAFLALWPLPRTADGR